jgi:hypothetical protein
MHAWDNPRDPDTDLPPTETPDERDLPRRPDPDPEAQKAPGAGQEDGDVPGTPPMQAGGEEIALDAPGIASEPVGNDNIRDGTVGGVMGPPHASRGQGQGG